MRTANPIERASSKRSSAAPARSASSPTAMPAHIVVAEDLPVERILSREHVRVALRLIGHHQNIRRSDFRSMLGTGEANTSRILRMLERAGLVERMQRGRQIHLALTNSGREVVSSPAVAESQGADLAPVEPELDPTAAPAKQINNIVCYHQGRFIQYMYMAAEKHKKLKNELDNGCDVAQVNEDARDLIEFINSEFYQATHTTFSMLKEYFLCSRSSAPRVCLKGGFPDEASDKVRAIFRDGVVDYDSSTEAKNNTGYLQVIATGRYYLQNNIPDAFARNEYVNPRLDGHRLSAGAGTGGGLYEPSWDELWNDYSPEKAGDASFYKSTLIVPLTFWNNSLSPEFKRAVASKGDVFGSTGGIGKTIFGFLCFDHRHVDYFVEADISVGYVAADLLSMYIFTRRMYTDMSESFQRVREILNTERFGLPRLPKQQPEPAQTLVSDDEWCEETSPDGRQVTPERLAPNGSHALGSGGAGGCRRFAQELVV
jgi:MarR family protein